MLRTTLIFGLLAGFFLACLQWIIYPLCYRGYLTLDNSNYVGFAGMLIVFSLIFFAVRSYREGIGGGHVTFWKALQVGLLITLVASVVQAAGWHIYNFVNPDFKDFFIQKFTEYSTRGLNAASDQAAIDSVKQQIELMRTIYSNPLLDLLFSFAMTAPVGIIVSLITAFILKRPPRASEPK
jgi:hypothetical protein